MIYLIRIYGHSEVLLEQLFDSTSAYFEAATFWENQKSLVAEIDVMYFLRADDLGWQIVDRFPEKQ